MDDEKDSKAANVPAPQGGNIDDVEIESYNDDNFSNGEMTPEDRIKKLRGQLRVCTREKQDYLDGWQRAKADFVNLKKREEEGRGEFVKFAREEVIADLLPVLESFHMAFANKEAWGRVDQAWRSGVEYIHTQLLRALEGHGLTEIDPIGKDFDPNEHSAVGIVPTEDPTQHHKIAQVLQLGYRLNGKLLRSPKVKVYGEKGGDATSATSA